MVGALCTFSFSDKNIPPTLTFSQTFCLTLTHTFDIHILVVFSHWILTYGLTQAVSHIVPTCPHEHVQTLNNLSQ